VSSSQYGLPEMLKSNVKTPILNDLGNLGRVYLNEGFANLNVLIDIASSWLSVISSECDSTCSFYYAYNMSKGTG
jgi:hypothetical protein